jgi:hypothetical protein
VSANQGRSRIERLELATAFAFNAFGKKQILGAPQKSVLFSILIFEKINYCVFPIRRRWQGRMAIDIEQPCGAPSSPVAS